MKPSKGHGRKVEDSDEDDEVPNKHKGKGKGRDKKNKNKNKKKGAQSDDDGGPEVKPERDAMEEGEEKQEDEGKSAISPHLMDEHFKEAFLNTLKVVKIEPELPIDSGRFYSDYMSHAASEGVTLNIKDSTYKKLGRFY